MYNTRMRGLQWRGKGSRGCGLGVDFWAHAFAYFRTNSFSHYRTHVLNNRCTRARQEMMIDAALHITSSLKQDDNTPARIQ